MENKLFNFNRVLCLSPHPDDVEYSIGGTIIKYKNTIFDILCLSMGGDCDPTTSENRLAEVKNFWKGITNVNLIFTKFKFIRDNGNVDSWVNYIETNFLSNQDYEAILTTSKFDSHFEHVFVQSLAAPLSRVKFYNLIEYKSPSSTEEFISNLIIPINCKYQIKKDRLKNFQSQLSRPYFNETMIDGFHTNFQSLKRGLGFVEQFRITQLIA